jgi:hypothetical protein
LAVPLLRRCVQSAGCREQRVFCDARIVVAFHGRARTRGLRQMLAKLHSRLFGGPPGMKAIVARPILLAAFTAMIPAAAHAIEIKTPRVPAPHINVPQVQSPKTNAPLITSKANAPLTTGNSGGSGSQGQGSTGSNGAKGGAKPLQKAVFHFFAPDPANGSSVPSSPSTKPSFVEGKFVGERTK